MNNRLPSDVQNVLPSTFDVKSFNVERRTLRITHQVVSSLMPTSAPAE